MGLLERMAAVRQPDLERAWPVGERILVDPRHGHDDARFSPEGYGDYIATSNDVYTLATLRARLVAGLRPLLFDGDGPDKVAVTSGPVRDLLHKVNPFWTFRRLQFMDELCMCLWGESYWAVQRDGRGNPVEVWWMKPTRVRPVPDESGYLAGFLYTPAAGGDLIPFGVDEVVWFRYPNPVDEFSPLSPLAAARLAADTASAMQTSNKKIFDQGLQMAGTISPADPKVTFSADQAAELEGDLSRRFTGVNKAHRWAVLRFDAKFNQMTVSQKDAQFVEGLNLTFRQVCRAYHVPSPLVGDLEHATLANAQEFTKLLWAHGLVPDADFKAAEIEEQFLPMFRSGPDHLEWDYSRVPALQESESSVWDREASQLDRGVVTINEVRRKRGQPDVPWGDVAWLPVNKAPIADDEMNPTAESAVAPAVPPTDDPPARSVGLSDLVTLRAAFNGHGLRREGALT